MLNVKVTLLGWRHLNHLKFFKKINKLKLESVIVSVLEWQPALGDYPACNLTSSLPWWLLRAGRYGHRSQTFVRRQQQRCTSTGQIHSIWNSIFSNLPPKANNKCWNKMQLCSDGQKKYVFKKNTNKTRRGLSHFVFIVDGFPWPQMNNTADCRHWRSRLKLRCLPSVHNNIVTGDRVWRNNKVHRRIYKLSFCDFGLGVQPLLQIIHPPTTWMSSNHPNVTSCTVQIQY